MNSLPSWQFRLFNYPVRVHLSFFLIALVLGLNSGNLLYVALWIVIVFVSILLHELGHALVSDHFGRSPSIELLWSGGLTISSRYALLSYPKEIMISFAGPLAGFLLGGLILLLGRVFGPFQPGSFVDWIYSSLLWINIGWGIFNLIPILPLDGGAIMSNLIHWLKRPYDNRTPHIISIVFGIITILTILILFRRSGLYVAIVIAMLTYNNYAALEQGPSDRLFR